MQTVSEVALGKQAVPATENSTDPIKARKVGAEVVRSANLPSQFFHGSSWETVRASCRAGSRMSRSNHAALTADDRERLASQCEQILEKLKEAGAHGVPNYELFPVAHALNARVSDLRKRGFEIKCEREEGGVWRYWLISKGSVQLDWYEQQTGKPRKSFATANDELPLFRGGNAA